MSDSCDDNDNCDNKWKLLRSIVTVDMLMMVVMKDINESDNLDDDLSTENIVVVYVKTNQ